MKPANSVVESLINKVQIMTDCVKMNFIKTQLKFQSDRWIFSAIPKAG